MTNKSKPHIAILTSGGDVPGLNACIRAVALAAERSGFSIVGVAHGYDGLIDGEFLHLETEALRAAVPHGGTILRSARSKRFTTAEGRAEAAKKLRAAQVDSLIVIGGDGSLTGAAAFAAEHGFAVMGIPKTIDNDVEGTDVCIGFDTAVNTAMQAIDRIRDTADSHARIFAVEVMGRDSGYLAWAAGMAGAADGILIPETDADWRSLEEKLKARHKTRSGSLLVVVAEGDETGGAAPVAKRLQAAFPEESIGMCILGHTQRGGSPTAADRILATRFAVAAVDAIAAGKSAMMTALIGDDIRLVPIASVRRRPLTLTPERLRLMEILI
jgi:6-phosphofructokinase 1